MIFTIFIWFGLVVFCSNATPLEPENPDYNENVPVFCASWMRSLQCLDVQLFLDSLSIKPRDCQWEAFTITDGKKRISGSCAQHGYIAINGEQNDSWKLNANVVLPAGMYDDSLVIASFDHQDDGSTQFNATVLDPQVSLSVPPRSTRFWIVPHVPNFQPTRVYVMEPLLRSNTIVDRTMRTMFLKGGVTGLKSCKHVVCTTNIELMRCPCSIPIQYPNVLHLSTRAWKLGDHFLDWYGREDTQPLESSDGSIMEITQSEDPHRFPVYDIQGQGYNAETSAVPFTRERNNWWLFDVLMDCNAPALVRTNMFFEFKASVSSGKTQMTRTEHTIKQNQPTPSYSYPYSSIHHWGKCGTTTFTIFDSESVFIQAFED